VKIFELSSYFDNFSQMPRRKVVSKARDHGGARLKRLRSQMGMTMREFGKEFNVGFSSISHWENGAHTIPGSVIRLIEIYEQAIESSSLQVFIQKKTQK